MLDGSEYEVLNADYEKFKHLYFNSRGNHKEVQAMEEWYAAQEAKMELERQRIRQDIEITFNTGEKIVVADNLADFPTTSLGELMLPHEFTEKYSGGRKIRKWIRVNNE